MANYDGEIKLGVQLDTSKTKSSTDELSRNMEKALSSSDSKIKKTGLQMEMLSAKIEKIAQRMKELEHVKFATSEFQQLQKDIDSTTKQLERAKSRMDEMRAGGKATVQTDEYKKLLADQDWVSRRINTLSNKTKLTDDQRSELEGLQQELRDIKGEIDAVKDAGMAFQKSPAFLAKEQEAQKLSDVLTDLNAKSQTMQQSGDAFIAGTETAEYQQLAQNLQHTSTQAEIMNQKFRESRKIGEQVLNTFKNLASAAAGAFKKIGSYIKNHLNKSTNDAHKSFSKLLRQVIKYGLGVRSVFLLYRKLRAYATEAFKSMATQYSDVNDQLSDIVSSFGQFKNSIATALQPLLSVVLPILNTIINAFITAANAIGSFFAALTGQGFIYKAVKQQKNFADAVGGAGGAAKEAKEELAEYDKLLVISSNDAGGGGGGGGGGAAGDMFEKADLTESAANFAQMIKDAWKDADFTEVGEYIGTKLTDALNSIPWAKIQETAGKVGKSIATFLNGLISPDLFGTLGTTLAEALNTAIEASRQFLENFDWANLGISLATGINKFFQTWKIEQLGTNIHTAIVNASNGAVLMLKATNFEGIGKKIASFLNNIIQPDSLSGLGEALGEAINAAIRTLKGFVENLNWREIGTSLMTGLMNLIKTTNWKDIGGTLSSTLSGLLNLITEAIHNLDIGAIWTAIKDFISGIDWLELGKSVIELLFSAIGSVLTGVVDVGMDIVSTVAGWFEDIGSAGWDGLWEGFWNTVYDIATWLDEKFHEYIIDPIKELLGIASPSKVFEEIGDMMMEGLLNGLMAGFELIKEWVVGAVDWLSRNLGDPIVEFGAKMIGLEEDPLAKANEEAEKTAQENQLKYNYYDMRARAREAGVDGGFWDIQNYGINEAVTAIQQLGVVSSETADSIQQDTKNTGVVIKKESKQSFKNLEKSFDGSTEWAEDTVTGIKVGFSKLPSEVQKTFIETYDKSTSTFKGVNQWSKQKSNETALGFSNMPNQVADYYKKAYENGKTQFSSSYEWAVKTSKITSSGFDGLPSDIQGKFKKSYDDGTGVYSDIYTWAVGRKDDVSKGLSPLPGAVSSKFKQAYADSTYAWKDTQTFGGGVATRFALGLAPVQVETKGIFQKAMQEAQGQTTGFQNWFNKQTFQTTAKFAIDTPSKSSVQGIWNDLADIWSDRHASFTISASGDVQDMKDQINAQIIYPFNTQLRQLRDRGLIKSSYQMTPLAQGAVLPPNKPFMALVGDQKYGTNIETPLSTMIDAFNTALENRGGAGPQTINVNVDGRTLAQVVWDENEKKYKQTGRRYG